MSVQQVSQSEAARKCGGSPDSRVLGIADGRQLLGEQRVHLGVDGDQLSQRLGGPQPHGAARVLQGLQEGGLQLRQEGLQGNAHLEERHGAHVRTGSIRGQEVRKDRKWWGTDFGQQQGEGLQQSRLHRPGETVSQDTDERSSDVDDRGPKRFGGRQLDDCA